MDQWTRHRQAWEVAVTDTVIAIGLVSLLLPNDKCSKRWSACGALLPGCRKRVRFGLAAPASIQPFNASEKEQKTRFMSSVFVGH